MSAVKNAQEKVAGLIRAADGELVAGFDFSILISLAMKLLMDYLSSCMNTNAAKAEERVKDSFWFSYFARKAAKDAVEQKYGKHKERKKARDLLSDSIEQLDVSERIAILEETKEAESDAGLLI